MILASDYIIQVMMKASLKFLFAILICVLIELLIFNFNGLVMLLDTSLSKNINYDMHQVKVVNWMEKNGELVSSEDPMLIIEGINKYVKTVKVETKLSKKVPFMIIYYTNDKILQFNDNNFVFTEDVQDVNLLAVDDQVNDLRIDLGDNAGVVLSDIKIIINPVAFDFSIARVVAMLLIYLLSTFLFTLQKSPNYNFD